MIHLLKRIFPVVFLSLALPAFTQDNYKVMIDYQFDDIREFSSNGLASVKKGYKHGFIDQTGKVVIDYQFDFALDYSSNGLAPVKKGNKFGYIDQTGKMIIDYQFDFALSFESNGLAPVEKGDKYGFIDQTGKVVIDYQFDNIAFFSSNGLASVEKGNKFGYIDQTGKMIIDYQFDYAREFSSNGLAAVQKGDKFGYIDQTGRAVIDYQFDFAFSFESNGLASVQKGNKRGFIDQTGKVVIDYQFDDSAFSFESNGLASVQKGDKWGFIDQTGKVVIDYQFDNFAVFSSNGLASVKKGDKWGFIDQTGKMIIDYKFDYAREFSSNGLAAVKKGDKWGFIKLAIPANDITEYIKAEIAKWQEKGKYETTEIYKARVTEVNRKKKIEELLPTAVQNTAPTYCQWNTIASEYDADNQTFKVNVAGLQTFYVKVPLPDAESFDAAIARLQFSDMRYGIGSDGKFFLQSADILNPDNSKTYSYSSSNKAEFAYTQFSINFEPLELNLQTLENSPVVKTETKVVTLGLSDVDMNIPVNQQTSDKTFAVIIANENYQKEVKVQYASNDGKVFKAYCEKTLGIPSKNIHFVQDASFGNMRSEIKWISDVASAYNGQAKIIFYYAGHGMPDEADKSAYLLPVDGFSSDYESAIKLEDLYSRLTTNPSQSITVFLDACFSGSARDNAMLANARAVKIKPKTDFLKGNMIVFSAATGDETAYPYKEKQHGLFTYFLLKKLQETKGNADFKTLSGYITENVKQQSIVVNQKSQTPQVNTSSAIQNSWQTMKLK